MSFFKKLGHALGSVTKVALAPVTFTTKGVGSVVGHIPVVGKPFKAAIDVAATGPLQTATNIANGARIDHAVMAGVKTQVRGAKTLAPYAKLVVSQIPGIGLGANAAIAAGTALVNGKRIDKAVVDGVKSAIPADLHGTFDTAFKMAATATADNRKQLDAAQKKLAPEARKVFQSAQALGHAARLQSVVKKVATTPGTTLKIKAAGASKITLDPVLAAGKLVLAYDKAIEHGYEMAIGTFAHDTPVTAIDAIRKNLNPTELLGFNIGMAVHLGMSLHSAPSSLPPREKFGYFAVYGMQTATNAQKTAMLSTVQHDNSARVGAIQAISEIKTGWWPRLTRWVSAHVHRKAS